MRPKGDAAVLEDRRRRAVQMLEDGATTRRVAEHFGVTTRAVRKWRQTFREQGWEGLEARPVPGRSSKLGDRQREQLCRILRRGARKAGFATDLWTCKRVAKVVRQEFQVNYHPDHISRILKDLGFTRQKPQRRARERDPDAAERWRKRDWPRVKKGSKPEC